MRWRGQISPEGYILSSPAGGLCADRLLTSTGILLSGVREAQRSAPLQSLAAAWKAVIPLMLRQRDLAPVQMLHFHPLVRAQSSLRCQACGFGHSLDNSQRSFSPSPHPQPTKAIPQSLPFHNSSKADASVLPGAGNVRSMARAQCRCQVDSSLLALAHATAWPPWNTALPQALTKPGFLPWQWGSPRIS